MIGIFITVAFIISGLLFLNKNIVVNYSLLVLYAAVLLAFSFFEYNHLNISELVFFKPDSLGILLLIALCIIA